MTYPKLSNERVRALRSHGTPLPEEARALADEVLSWRGVHALTPIYILDEPKERGPVRVVLQPLRREYCGGSALFACSILHETTGYERALIGWYDTELEALYDARGTLTEAGEVEAACNDLMEVD
jgi:hypothetical protein